MLTSSVSGNGLPPDLEFTLDEISTELAKLGVKETSPTRLAAIKVDLDRLIARDLETLSISLNKEASTTSPRSRSDSASFSVSVVWYFVVFFLNFPSYFFPGCPNLWLFKMLGVALEEDMKPTLLEVAQRLEA